MQRERSTNPDKRGNTTVLVREERTKRRRAEQAQFVLLEGPTGSVVLDGRREEARIAVYSGKPQDGHLTVSQALATLAFVERFGFDRFVQLMDAAVESEWPKELKPPEDLEKLIQLRTKQAKEAFQKLGSRMKKLDDSQLEQCNRITALGDRLATLEKKVPRFFGRTQYSKRVELPWGFKRWVSTLGDFALRAMAVWFLVIALHLFVQFYVRDHTAFLQ